MTKETRPVCEKIVSEHLRSDGSLVIVYCSSQTARARGCKGCIKLIDYQKNLTRKRLRHPTGEGGVIVNAIGLAQDHARRRLEDLVADRGRPGRRRRRR